MVNVVTLYVGNISPYTPQRQPSLPRLRSSLKKANEGMYGMYVYDAVVLS